MSYCVNCGVKLKQSERKCPLCDTPVINPNHFIEEYEPVYPTIMEEFQRINFKYISKLIVLILSVLGLVTVLCDLITSRTISWSIYVVCSILYLSCHLSLILCKNVYASLIIELIGTELFLFVIAILNNGLHWYLYLVLPFVFIIWLYILFCIALMKIKRKNILRRLSVCFLLISIALIAIESGIDLYNFNKIEYNWSIYAFLPITIISILTFILSYNKKVLDTVRQKMFF